MPPRRPEVLTAFGILNIIFGCLFLLCTAGGTAKTTVTINNQDVTQELNDFMNREIPGYTAVRTMGLVAGLSLAVGFIVSGIGLLNVANWGRVLALVCAGLGILHQLGMGIYQLAVVNPAMSRFLSSRFPNPFGFFGIIPQMLGVAILIAAFIAVTYNVILIVGLLSKSASRAFAGLPTLDDHRDEEDWDDRPRRPSRRRASWDEEEEDEQDDRIRHPPRRPPPREDEDEPPRRRPSRPRYEDEEDDEEDDRRSPRRRR